MKAILSYKFFLPSHGGIEYLMHLIAQGLNETCEDVCVLTTNLYQETLRFVPQSAFRKVKVVCVPAVSPLRQVDLEWSVSTVFSIIKKYDIIHVFGCLPSGLFYAVLIASKLLRVPLIWQPIFHPTAIKTHRSFVLKLIRLIHDKSLLKFYSKFPSIILALTEDEAKFFETFFTGKIYVIGECVEERAYSGNVPIPKILEKYALSESEYLLSVGRIAWYKGHDLLINAWKNVEKDFPDIKLVIVGKDWGFKKELESIIKKFDIKNIIFIGDVDDQILYALYEGALAVASTSRFEAFHRIALEAWSHRKPIIALNLGGPTKHITVDSGILIENEDEREVEKAIRTLLSDIKKAHFMGENGYRIFKEKYETYSYTYDLIKIYYEALKMRP